MNTEHGINVTKLLIKGALLGVIAGLLTALFDGSLMLASNMYVPLSYPVLLIIFNTFFWMTFGSISGVFLWLYSRNKKDFHEKENLFWVLFFLLPFAVVYGLMGRYYLPMKVWWPAFPPVVFDHHLSFFWTALIFVFLIKYFKKTGDKRKFPAILFTLEITIFILFFQLCSNLRNFIHSERILFLIAVYILLVLSIAGFYFITFFKIRPFIKGKLVRNNYITTAILFLVVSGCLTGFYTLSCIEYNKKLFSPLAVKQDKTAAKVSHVILIVWDTVRADRLSIYGNLKTTKNLEKFAGDGLVFEKCIAPSSWTVPSHASLFTGLYPLEHGSHGTSDPEKKSIFNFPLPDPLSDEFVTLAEIFRDSGYITAGIISNGILKRKEYRITQGFQIINRGRKIGSMYQKYAFRPCLYLLSYLTNLFPKYALHYRTADEITTESIRVIEKFAPAPFFLFANYLDAHFPYAPPRPFAGYFLDTPLPQLYRLKQHFLHFIDKANPTTWDSYNLSQYDGEIAYLDAELGKLLSRLKQMGLYESSLIIVTSDHGELFGEHGFYRHRVPTYEGAVKVPLVIKFPFSKKIGREKKMLSLTDLFPTILSICGLPVPDLVSGKAFGDGSSPVASEFYTYDIGKHLSLYDGKYKYMRYELDRGPELYDLDEDPLEQNNCVEKLPEVVLSMEEKLKGWEQSHGPKYTSSRKVEEIPSKGVLEDLRGLGYIQ